MEVRLQGRTLTPTADIEDHVVLLRIQPLHNLCGELGHERGRVLVSLPHVSDCDMCVVSVYMGDGMSLASEDQLSCWAAMLSTLWLLEIASK